MYRAFFIAGALDRMMETELIRITLILLFKFDLTRFVLKVFTVCSESIGVMLKSFAI